jgi:hypothetical protein
MKVRGQLCAPADLLLVEKYVVPIEWAPELVFVLEKRKITVLAGCTIFACSLVCV